MAYSTGVLHHTPDPPAAFACLPPLVKPGGRVMTMVYAKYNKAYLTTVEFTGGSQSAFRSGSF